MIFFEVIGIGCSAFFVLYVLFQLLLFTLKLGYIAEEFESLQIKVLSLEAQCSKKSKKR